jgi:O-antigen ligase
MTIFNFLIKLVLIFLLVFTPIAFGSMELWAFSIMELAILFIIILWAVQNVIVRPRPSEKSFNSAIGIPQSAIPMVLLSLFLLLILFQLLPLPSGLLKIVSTRTWELRHQLRMTNDPLPMTPLSFFPFLTQIEFFKWLTLAGLFIFLLRWSPMGQGGRTKKQLILAVMAVGVLESLYGIFEFFSGHHHILHLEAETLVSAVTGTFINRNYLAGYLLMVVPVSIGFLFSREAARDSRYRSWRERLSALDGKTLLVGFSIIVMILGLIFTASRMGILSLLLSFSLISFLFRNPENAEKGKRFSKTAVLIFGLAFLWAAWIGLDAVISRFFSVSEGFEGRWKIWVNTFQIFRDFPIFGSGLGTFVQVFPMYRSFPILGLVTHSENDFLQFLSETGILGTGLLAVLFFFLLFKAFSGVRALSRREPARYIALGGLVGILALMFHSLVERNIQVPANAFLYTVLWAIVLRITEKGAISKSAYQNISAPVGRISEHRGIS